MFIKVNLLLFKFDPFIMNNFRTVSRIRILEITGIFIRPQTSKSFRKILFSENRNQANLLKATLIM